MGHSFSNGPLFLMITDANKAVARVAYHLSDNIPVYPITPATPMMDWVKLWNEEELPNIESNVPLVSNWQSESGVAGALHGALECGGRGTTFTSSQGLLMMVPAMHRMAGSKLPHVIHVATRSIAKQALSIFSDHSDILAVHGTGYALLTSANTQEAQDMACIAHLTSLKCSIPFVHFFDGFKTSHAIEKIAPLSYPQLEKIWSEKNERSRHNANHNFISGAAQTGAQYFSSRKEFASSWEQISSCVDEVMSDFESVTGRKYRSIEYVGDEKAETVFVAMASAVGEVKEAMTILNNKNKKVGLLIVRLFKPLNHDLICELLPSESTKVVVLEATCESLSGGGPLFMEVNTALSKNLESSGRSFPKISSLCYGLSGFPLTASMIIEYFSKNNKDNPSYKVLDRPKFDPISGHNSMTEGLLSFSKSMMLDIETIANYITQQLGGFIQVREHVLYEKNMDQRFVQLRWSKNPIERNHLLPIDLMEASKDALTLENEQGNAVGNIYNVSLESPVNSTILKGILSGFIDESLRYTSSANTKIEEDAFFPVWDPNSCTQCGLCSLVCPTSALQAKSFSAEYAALVPEGGERFLASDISEENHFFSISIEASECDTCQNCVQICPEHALELKPIKEENRQKKFQRFFNKIEGKTKVNPDLSETRKLQFTPSLYKHPISGKGAAVSVYFKVLSQLFGERLMIANATGSSSIIAGTEGNSPWVSTPDQKGVSWANSLFENNAEFALGMRLQLDLKGDKRKSVWAVGGDGWAYDIGFGGLDHVLASGKNVNILVLDNELYENTGGQFSKASTWAANGIRPKKDLGSMAMTYEDVYVASVAYGANPEQMINVLKEAEAFPGPSLILAYCHSETHGIDDSRPHLHHQAAVDSGQWLLYRRDPRKSSTPFLDSDYPSLPLISYWNMEQRFRKMLDRLSEEEKSKFFHTQQTRLQDRLKKFQSNSISEEKVLFNAM